MIGAENPTSKDEEAQAEEDLTPHKDKIIGKLASLNRDHLMTLLNLLEEKTVMYNKEEESGE